MQAFIVVSVYVLIKINTGSFTVFIVKFSNLVVNMETLPMLNIRAQYKYKIRLPMVCVTKFRNKDFIRTYRKLFY